MIGHLYYQQGCKDEQISHKAEISSYIHEVLILPSPHIQEGEQIQRKIIPTTIVDPVLPSVSTKATTTLNHAKGIPTSTLHVSYQFRVSRFPII